MAAPIYARMSQEFKPHQRIAELTAAARNAAAERASAELVRHAVQHTKRSAVQSVQHATCNKHDATYNVHDATQTLAPYGAVRSWSRMWSRWLGG